MVHLVVLIVAVLALLMVVRVLVRVLAVVLWQGVAGRRCDGGCRPGDITDVDPAPSQLLSLVCR